MLRFKEIILFAGMLLYGIPVTAQISFENAVKTAVNNQMAIYPLSTLRDLYKNFFQDRFGPGHLIQDTAAAGNYLRNELASFNNTTGAYYESTGWKGCFYRVNLSVIKENIVPYELFFDAFVRSVNGITPTPIDIWKKEWLAIDSIIQTIELPLTSYENDRQEIFELLEQGKYVMHHSSFFETHYNPHYRIIEKNIFEKEIYPLLPK